MAAVMFGAALLSLVLAAVLTHERLKPELALSSE